MEIPASAPSAASVSVIRRIQVEYLGDPRPSANDVDHPSFLINAGAPNSTTYCFIAPRVGRRR